MSTLDAREAYEALAVTGEACARGIEIRCTSRGGAISYAVTYNSLHRVSYNRLIWTRIFMWAGRLTIEIRGRNLQPIIEAIRTRTCGFIQEYSEDEHIRPETIDLDAPFIESISVEVIGGRIPPAKPADV